MRTEARESLALLLAVCGLACSSAKAQDIIAGPFSRGSSQYYLTSLTNWTSAEALAVSMGGHLVTIETSAENQWLGSTVLPHSPVGPWAWIGLTDEADEGTWVWVSGSSASYRSWGGSEPNNCTSALGDEDYACFYSALAWADYPQDPANPCYTPLHSLMPGLIEVPCAGNNAPPR